MKRVGYGVLFFLVGILFPILIWVGLFIAIRRPVLYAVRRVAAAALALLTGTIFPILIWVGFGAAVSHWIRERRLQREPSRTVAEILAAAGLSTPWENSKAAPLAVPVFVKCPMSEIQELLTRVGL